MSASALASGIARLGRALRERGVAVCVSDEIDAARALARLPGADGREARCALRIALKLQPRDWGRSMMEYPSTPVASASPSFSACTDPSPGRWATMASWSAGRV